MSKNIEFKAYYSNQKRAKQICNKIGAKFISKINQKDTYFKIKNGKLKLRENSNSSKSLIFYIRENSPSIRESIYEKIDLDHFFSISVLSYLFDKINVVEKVRTTYQLESTLIHLDEVKELGKFIEIEVMTNPSDSLEKQYEQAEKLKKIFGIELAEIVPWSYSDYKLIKKSAKKWINKYNRCKNKGKLFFIDGPSGSGKTTLTNLIKNNNLNLHFVPRFSTRKRRKGEISESEYIFISKKQFDDYVNVGYFIEFRNFKFGMSYGHSWELILSKLLSGKNVIGIINWGNIYHIKKIFPSSITILVSAPKKVIKERLIKRGMNNNEQINERLGNYNRVKKYKKYYDYCINNSKKYISHASMQLEKIIKKNI